MLLYSIKCVLSVLYKQWYKVKLSTIQYKVIYDSMHFVGHNQSYWMQHLITSDKHDKMSDLCNHRFWNKWIVFSIEIVWTAEAIVPTGCISKKETQI